ncbi:CRISPR system precrRNA processing endoribonuclease RAMP protein Cas6 [Geitlerinema sp. PCC 9228]|jgi:CRISPR-associated endoribonuclease Cas6|uniref:CRISPR system precrRNA processing endoribonuclease RAMP protein Cas6 n=1 Tax=Geitlerinema sp. PCC 9228 TaxID=111611 RepID=UPI0008F9E469|nr:CRISPR system precrRNA processing endoribonuclease RAMP protein Cas6 [Geitlerinema sp. PCC 9228]
MLIESKWQIAVSEATTIPRSYRIALAKELHQRLGWEMGGNDIPPITSSGIIGVCSTSKEYVTFHPEECYTLYLCGLNEAAAKAIASLELPPTLAFLGGQFHIRDRQDTTTTYEQLYTATVAEEPEPTRHFNLRFLSPTAFSQGKTHLPLPVPTLMFRSWLERWNHFASIYLGGDELIAYLQDAVVIQRHNIQTSRFQLSKGYINGFAGSVTLRTFHRVDPLLANVVHLLIEYGRFAGTGIKTRLGMGKTELMLPEASMEEKTVA